MQIDKGRELQRDATIEGILGKVEKSKVIEATQDFRDGSSNAEGWEGKPDDLHL